MFVPAKRFEGLTFDGGSIEENFFAASWSWGDKIMLPVETWESLL